MTSLEKNQNPQLLASSPDISCFVMASAGTGKTKMLVDRLLRLLLNGIPFSSILCLTFTKAGAGEMYQRLFERAEHLLSLKGDDLNIYLDGLDIEVNDEVVRRSQALFFDLLNEQQSFKIQTIHSFCQSLLEANAWGLGMTPPFSIIEEGDQKSMILKSLDAISFDESYKVYFDVIISFMGKNQFLDLLEQSIFLKEDVLEKSLTPLLLTESQVDVNPESLLANLPEELLEEIIESGKPLRDVFLTKDGTSRSRIFKKDILKKYDGLEELASEIASMFEELEDQKKIRSLEVLNLAFFTLSKAVKQHYQSQKKERSLLDFNDLISFSHQILTSSNFAFIEQKLGYKIKSILVDEAQDTSPLQWDIITNLVENMLLIDESNDASLLVVGDLKQAIYGFQGAEPDLFLEKQEFFKSLFDHYKKPFKVLNLIKSYRCTKDVLNAVDTTFNTHPLGLYLKDLPLEHIPHRTGEGAVHVIKALDPIKNEDTSWTLPDERIQDNFKVSALSNSIVSLIDDLLNSNIILDSTQNRIKPEDIMILVRNRSSIVESLIQNLYQKNIPCSGLDRFLLNQHPMILDFLNLFSWMLSKNDDYTFVKILKSPFFSEGGIDECFLYEIVQKYSKNLWGHLSGYKKGDLAHGNENTLLACIDNFKKHLKVLDYISLTSFLSALWKEWSPSFLNVYGMEALEIYEAFYQIVYALSQKKHLTMQELLFHLKTEEIEIKKDVASKDFEQVRLMTIHGSKGLEAPVVILADTNLRQTLQKERLLKFEGRYIIKPSDLDCPKILKDYKDIALIRLQEEEQRLLYVAMTRAKDHLYIFGTTPVIKDSWYEKLLGTVESNTLEISGIKDKREGEDAFDFMTPYYFKENIDLANLIQPDFVNSKEIERGVLIHKLLEDIIEIDHSQKEAYISGFINRYPDFLKMEDGLNLMSLMNHPDYALFFDKDAINEMAITYSGNLYRIDRFIQKDDLSIIIDFKSGKKTQKKYDAYGEQMSIYADAIKALYPKSKVISYILWVDDWIVDEINV